jgi:hypothetical protein
MTQTFFVDPTQGTNGTGTSGSPFNSLKNAHTAIGAAFDAAIEDYVINCLAGADNDTAFSWAFASTSATPRNLIIQATGANRHTGVRSSGYRRTATLQTVAGGNSATVISLQVLGIGLTGAAASMVPGGTLASLVDGCVAFDQTTDTAFGDGGVTPVVYTNCLAVNCGTTGVAAFNAANNFGVPNVKWVNCTAIAGPANGFNRSAGTASAINCYSGGNAGADFSGTITLTNCQHSSATSFTGATPNIAYSTANFTNVTIGSESALLPSSSALIGAGVGPTINASVPTIDFQGTARGGSTTDVGFDQRTAVVPGGAVLAATPTATSAVAAPLTTLPKLNATASAPSSATASLTNFSSVVLTAPQYLGPGSIYDANFWIDAAPVVGNTLFFDPKISVAPSGEVSSSTNPCQAVVQFNSG